MRGVSDSPELRRVRDIPRRQPHIDQAHVEELTEILRTPTGAMRLRAMQALALIEMMAAGGIFAALGVGEGKTLITLLAAYVLEAKRPILLLPGALVQKTDRDRVELSKHWKIPNHLFIKSYEVLGRVQAATDLEVYAPDLIIADEAHKLKNRRAAVTRRVARYMAKHPSTKFVALSGTFMRKSLTELGHLLRWTLKDAAPVPHNFEELEEWAMALDEDLSGREGNYGADELGRLEPGALLSLANQEELAQGALTGARNAFRRRLMETQGVVATTSANREKVDASIYIKAITYRLSPKTTAGFHDVRHYKSAVDGWPLNSGAEVWADAKELALGLSYTWDPRPPKEWTEARRAWGAFVRETISHSRSLDSELHVAQAVLAGRLDDGGVLARWSAVKDSFVPNPVPVWFEDSVLELCARWAREAPGVIWTEHGFFAERLSEYAGLPYFGAKGLDYRGRFIDDADPKQSAIVSIDANKEGRNLQTKWNRCLFTSPPEGSDIWDQAIGRFHRPGLKADEVIVDVLLGCAEHANAMRKALAGARAVTDTVGGESKLLLAEIDWPNDIELATSPHFKGPRWG